ncbi:hypothetical protein [Streptomyces fagopyri]
MAWAEVRCRAGVLITESRIPATDEAGSKVTAGVRYSSYDGAL